jgi:hypothetical protein
MSGPKALLRWLLARELAPVHQARIVIPHADVLTAPTVPVVIVAAPGAGYVVIPTLATLRTRLTAAYGNVDANVQAFLAWHNAAQAGQSAGVGWLDETTTEQLAVMLAYTNAGAANLSLVADFENLAIELVVLNASAGNFEDGDASNAIVLTLAYHVVQVTDGGFV